MEDEVTENDVDRVGVPVFPVALRWQLGPGGKGGKRGVFDVVLELAGMKTWGSLSTQDGVCVTQRKTGVSGREHTSMCLSASSDNNGAWPTMGLSASCSGDDLDGGAKGEGETDEDADATTGGGGCVVVGGCWVRKEAGVINQRYKQKREITFGGGASRLGRDTSSKDSVGGAPQSRNGILRGE